jgi:hypothetical protein
LFRGGKQHVFLYRGLAKKNGDWKKSTWVQSLLKRYKLDKYLNATVQTALPKQLTISSIIYDGKRLRVVAIRKREWWERQPELDDTSQTDDGDPVTLRAFVRRITRGIVAFEWDVVANTAFLQISQLATGYSTTTSPWNLPT